MFTLGADLKVYLRREPIDFRAGINSLAVLVQETMALDPFAPAVFAFCNRRRDRMKLLFFDRSGFVLVLKRLTEDRYRWPRRQEVVVTLTTEQLHWILDGIDIDAMVRQPITRAELSSFFGKEISRDLIGHLRGAGVIVSGPRSPTRGAAYSYITTKAFLLEFGLDTLRDLPDFKKLEDAGLLNRAALLAEPAIVQSLLGENIEDD
ncbi:IS66 family insertion sequence element accessory protein TnpB [Mesorhizobium sp. YR577]|uniref:IS66 family insertion sequence element accessory protein TnpB n=1 Tax=Mesorhizobium sp. YR577 TaxID=1884373 RepID=UPI0008EF8A87|nr:IS66 family insertion sequence element accessory protein TnpB [Mesorhizobium sp. YR577]SFU22648.1 Putative transcriptional regulators (Ypuh-like) [Mesorhizobium sp. YR577]